MATSRLLLPTGLIRTRPYSSLLAATPLAARAHAPASASPFSATLSASFSSTPRRAATPHGPPPAGFRLPTKERWDESKESSLDKAGKYFLMTEMLRGMYVVLEQYFRPPYTIYYPFEKVDESACFAHRSSYPY
jgi:NADH dehydrogenase (ubiquinone) Fe-S protein 8